MEFKPKIFALLTIFVLANVLAQTDSDSSKGINSLLNEEPSPEEAQALQEGSEGKIENPDDVLNAAANNPQHPQATPAVRNVVENAEKPLPNDFEGDTTFRVGEGEQQPPADPNSDVPYPAYSRAADFADWMMSKAKNSPRSRGVTDLDRRIDVLRRYQQRHGYVVVPLEQRLTDSERVALAAIRAKIEEVRDDFRRLTGRWTARVRADHPKRSPSMEKTVTKKSAGTTVPGYVNRRQQRVVRNTGLPGNDHGQSTYELECLKCGQHYGANGSDIFQRRCPRCDGGAPGLPTS